jgi:hypothetical protein
MMCFSTCSPKQTFVKVWMPPNSVILTFNCVLNRKFCTLVDDRRQVSACHQ